MQISILMNFAPVLEMGEMPRAKRFQSFIEIEIFLSFYLGKFSDILWNIFASSFNFIVLLAAKIILLCVQQVAVMWCSHFVVYSFQPNLTISTKILRSHIKFEGHTFISLESRSISIKGPTLQHIFQVISGNYRLFHTFSVSDNGTINQKKTKRSG